MTSTTMMRTRQSSEYQCLSGGDAGSTRHTTPPELPAVVFDPPSSTWLRPRGIQLVHDTSLARRSVHFLFPDGSLRLRFDIHGVEALYEICRLLNCLCDGFLADKDLKRVLVTVFHSRPLHEGRTAHTEIQTTPEPKTCGDLRGRDPYEIQELKIEAHEHLDEDPHGPIRIQARCRR